MKNLKILQKKKLFFLVFFISILLVSNIQAITFATIAKTGLQFAAPEIAQAVNTAICLTNPIVCAQGKIIGYITGEVYKAAYKALTEIAGEETAREIANAINTYNQIKGYLDKGSEILEELKLNERGEIEKGTIHSKEDAIGNLINKDLDKDAVIITNISFNFETKEVIFKENGKLKIKIEKDGKQIERVYENIKENGKIILKEDGDVEEADITTSEKAEFIFGDNPKIYNIPADTRITYKEGIVTVYGKDKSFNLLSHGQQSVKILGKSVEISGNKIKGSEFNVNDVKIKGITDKGIIKLVENGYLVDKGIVEYKKTTIQPLFEKLLVAKPAADISDYKGNWLKLTDSRLEIKNTKGGLITLHFLPGNELFNMKKVIFENGKRKEISDEKDHLLISLTKDNYLEVKSRKHLGLIPKIKHESKGKKDLTIFNGRFQFFLSQEGLKSGSYEDTIRESVPFQLSSNVMNQELRVSSANEFVLLNEKTKEKRIVLNELGIPISDKIKDNEVQTLSYLREKWKNRKISFRTLIAVEKNPRTFQVIDYWLKKYPEAETDFTFTITTSGSYSTIRKRKTVYVGKDLNPHHYQKKFPKEIIKDRVLDPVNMLTHEYFHALQTEIALREDLIKEGKGFETLRNEILKEGRERLRSSKEYKEIIDNIYSELKKELSSKEFLEFVRAHKFTTPLSLFTIAEEMLVGIVGEHGVSGIERPEVVDMISIILRHNPLVAKEYLRLQKLVEKAGFPAVYSFRRDELFTTWAEEPLEQRIYKTNFGNENQRKVYKDLTQLSFDGDMINSRDYEQLMKVKCKTKNCLEYRCSRYKLLCCKKYPNSPNC